MKQQTNKLTSLLLVIIHIVSGLAIYSYENKLLGFLALFIQFGCLIGLFLLHNKVVNSFSLLFLLVVNILSLLVTMAFHSGLGVVGIYLNLLFALLIFGNISISKSTYFRIHFFTAFFISGFIFTAKIQPNYESIYVNGIFGDSINPNTLGLWALAGFFHWICAIEELKLTRLIKNMFDVIILIVFTSYIYISNCRSVLLSVLLYLLLLLFKKRPFTKDSFNKTTKVLLIASFFFTIIYLALEDKYSDVEILGKKLFSGRQYVWGAAFEQIKRYPLFGSGADFSMPMDSGSVRPTVSTHNTVLALWRTLGIIPMLTFIILCGRTTAFKSNTKVERVAQFAFVSCLLTSFYEQIFVDRVMYMLFLSFLLFNIKREEPRRMLTCK